MKRIDTRQDWTVRKTGDAPDREYGIKIPGSVVSGFPWGGTDPYFGDVSDGFIELLKNDFEFCCTFEVDAQALRVADEVLLRFNGIDTLADITLNGVNLGSADNMHRTWDFKVREYLKDGENKLVVAFHSPVEFIARAFEKDPLILGTEDAMRGFPNIRKAHYMFGWDWGPRIPDIGIWREMEVLAVRKAVLDSVYVRQAFEDEYKKALLSFETRTSGDHEGCRCLISVTGPQGEVIAENFDAGKTVVIENPKLWWPNGLGEQPLYTVTVSLVDESGEECDSKEYRIGLRELNVCTDPDEYGSEFSFRVNGVKFFAMGADYIPEDNVLSRMDAERTRKLLTDCVRANFNSVRVWGGGLYPSDDFFDICDELGLVVWQDFMFACANYRLTKEFEENILAELRDNIRRLRHHASLGLWCGNNEMETFVMQGVWGAHADDGIKADYLKMYEDLFPKLVKEEDPDRFYWPASPSSGGGFDLPDDPNRGDVHYWDVWHGNKPFTEYRKFYFRFLSEFGFQSFPSIRTVEDFTLPGDRNIFSYVMEKHQRNAAANGKIMNYMEQMFLYPCSLDTLIYASQLLQAEAIKYGVEHLRRYRGRCMGAIYWQLNDCWPVASWSSVDYHGRWKALHYYARRFFAPLLISCEEEGLLTQSLNVNAEPFEVKKSVRFNVANETKTERRCVVRWALRKNDGSALRTGTVSVTVPAFSSIWLDRIDIPEASLYEDHVSYSLEEADSASENAGKVVSEGNVLFCPPKHYRFIDPQLKVRATDDEITVSCSGFARSIEIRNANDNLILSDNFFDLNGGEKAVKVLEGTLNGLEVRSVYDIR